MEALTRSLRALIFTRGDSPTTRAQEGNRTPDLRMTSDYHFHTRNRLKKLSPSGSYVSSAGGESDYDHDKTDWQSEKHQPGSRAKGRTFIEGIVNEN